MLALGESRFLWVLVVVAIAEPLVLSAAHPTLERFAAVVLALQCLAAVGVAAAGWLTRADVTARAQP
jgi:hypothetical protein